MLPHTPCEARRLRERREPATVLSCKGNRRDLCALTSNGWFGSGHPLPLLTGWWDLLQQCELWYGNEQAKQSTSCSKSGMEVPWLVRTHLYIVSQRDGLLWTGESNNEPAHVVFCMRCSLPALISINYEFEIVMLQGSVTQTQNKLLQFSVLPECTVTFGKLCSISDSTSWFIN